MENLRPYPNLVSFMLIMNLKNKNEAVILNEVTQTKYVSRNDRKYIK